MVHLGKTYPYFVPARLFAADLTYPGWWPTEIAWSTGGWTNFGGVGTWPATGRGMVPGPYHQGDTEIDYSVTIHALTGLDPLVLTLKLFVTAGVVHAWPLLTRAGLPQSIQGPATAVGAGNTFSSLDWLIFAQWNLAPGFTVRPSSGGYTFQPVVWTATPPPPAPQFPWMT